MSVRNIIACAASLALIASAAGAQEPSRSKRERVQISKGEVALPARVDTVYVVRYDTTLQVVRDTVRIPIERVRTVTQYVEVPAVPVVTFKGPLYASFYGGALMPSGNANRLYSTGAQVGVAVGWEQEARALGFRFGSALGQLDRELGFDPAFVGTKVPLMISSTFDVKFIPLHFTNGAVYAIGGPNYTFYRGLALVTKDGRGNCRIEARGGCYQNASNTNWNGRFGYSAGGGADIRVAGQEMFLEGRASAIQSDRGRTWMIPITLGLRYF
jgi:hypothetical protein